MQNIPLFTQSHSIYIHCIGTSFHIQGCIFKTLRMRRLNKILIKSQDKIKTTR